MMGPTTITPTSILQFQLKLVVALFDLFTDESVELTGNEGGFMVMQNEGV